MATPSISWHHTIRQRRSPLVSVAAGGAEVNISYPRSEA
jgi:hypothetical protein